MLLTKQVEVTINSITGSYYDKLGYTIPKKEASKSYKQIYHKDFVYDYGKKTLVNIGDVPQNSHVKVDVECDYCHKNNFVMPYYLYNKIMSKDGKCCCKECVKLKIQENNLIKYGTPWTARLPEVREKFRQTMIQRYDYDNPLKVEEFKQKAIATMEERYNCKNISQNPEIQNKKFQTMSDNNSCPTSTQQEYIAKLYNATSNVPFNKYLLDMVLEFDDFKLDIEVDGSGHMMSVYRGADIKDFERKEIIRNNYVKQAGYKVVRIVSRKDRYPSDEKLLYMLEYAKNFFIENPERSWLTFDIDNSCIHNAYYKTSESGLPFDYGELRLIRNETDSEISDSEASDFDILDSDISDNSTYIPLTSPSISPYILVS